MNVRLTIARSCIFAVLCIFEVSCGTWVNPSNPQANYQADYADCEMQAAQQFPIQMQTSKLPDVTTTNCTVYGSTGSCTSVTSPGKEYNSGGDANLGNRLSATFNCIAGKGWQLSSEQRSTTVAPRHTSSSVAPSTTTMAAPTRPSPETDAERSRYGYFVGYDYANRMMTTVALLDNGAFMAGLDDGLKGKGIIPKPALEKLRGEILRKTVAINRPTEWELFPSRPEVNPEAPLAVQYGYAAGIDVATDISGVSQYIDIDTFKWALIETLNGRSSLSEAEATERKAEFAHFLQGRTGAKN